MIITCPLIRVHIDLRVLTIFQIFEPFSQSNRLCVLVEIALMIFLT